MKVKAPFTLHTVPIDTSNGQAAGERWYLAPFCIWKYKTILGETVIRFDYSRPGQYLGCMSAYAGKSIWRAL